MGIFSSKSPDPNTVAAWASKLRGFAAKDEARRWTLCDQFAHELGKPYARARVKRNLIDDRVELRARFGELEFAVSLDPESGRVGAKLGFPNRVGSLHLRFDRDLLSEPSANPGFVEPDATYRVFVGHAVFVEGEVSEVHQSLATFNGLAFDLRQELVTAIQEWQLSSFDAFQTEMTVDTARRSSVS
jgi:hypothetical protein